MALQTTRSASDATGIFHVASVAFSVKMDTSVNVAGMDISYAVSKVLNCGTNLTSANLNNVSFGHSDDEHTVAVTVTGNLDSFRDQINNTIAPSNTNWTDLSGVSYVGQDIDDDIDFSNVWENSVSDFCECVMNAAYDKQSDNIANSVSVVDPAPYTDLSQNNFDNFHYLNVNAAYLDSSDNIYNGSGASTFGALVAQNILDASGDLNLLTATGVVADVLRQATSEEDIDLDNTKTLGDILNGKKLELILQIRGNGTDGRIDVVNNAFGVTGDATGLGGFESVSGCVTMASSGVDEEDAIHIKPLNLLLRYTFA